MFHCLEELGLRRKRDSKSVPRDDSPRSARQLCGLERDELELSQVERRKITSGCNS